MFLERELTVIKAREAVEKGGKRSDMTSEPMEKLTGGVDGSRDHRGGAVMASMSLRHRNE
jgi:hypothetical protein